MELVRTQTTTAQRCSPTMPLRSAPRGEESIFVVRGVEQCEVQDAIDVMWSILERHQHEPLVYRIIDVTRDEMIRDQFKEMKGLLPIHSAIHERPAAGVIISPCHFSVELVLLTVSSMNYANP
mmetsp:Transcript_27681/g.61292  ORF Transcript_27681/g.61292 Transcript_27681/m.61292 type:complete len:123 (+) Transcript_27681:242-610(+)